MSWRKKAVLIGLGFLFLSGFFGLPEKKKKTVFSFGFELPAFLSYEEPQQECLIFQDALLPTPPFAEEEKEEETSLLRFHRVSFGETLETIAQNYGVSKETILANNDLKGTKLFPGQELLILPCEGLIYFPKPQDTLDKIAKNFGLGKEKILKDNQLSKEKELSQKDFLILCGVDLKKVAKKEEKGAKRNELKMKRKELKERYHSKSQPKRDFAETSGSYPFGYCTFYAAQQRKDLPSNLGNAKDWLKNAKAMGFSVCEGKDCSPKEGAVISLSSPHALGHVGVVKKVEGNQIQVCEMNLEGWNKVSCRQLQIGDPRIKGYIY